MYLFLERGEGKKTGRETSLYERETCPQQGDLAHNPGVCPDWEQDQRPSAHRPVLHPLSHTNQGCLLFL